jgi:hypothetical protein
MIKYYIFTILFISFFSCQRCKDCTKLVDGEFDGREEKCGKRLRMAEKNYDEGNGWKCE